MLWCAIRQSLATTCACCSFDGVNNNRLTSPIYHFGEYLAFARYLFAAVMILPKSCLPTTAMCNILTGPAANGYGICTSQLSCHFVNDAAFLLHGRFTGVDTTDTAFNRRFSKLLVHARQLDYNLASTTWEFLFFADFVSAFVVTNPDVSILVPDGSPYVAHVRQLWKSVEPSRFIVATDAGYVTLGFGVCTTPSHTYTHIRRPSFVVYAVISAALTWLSSRRAQCLY